MKLFYLNIQLLLQQLYTNRTWISVWIFNGYWSYLMPHKIFIDLGFVLISKVFYSIYFKIMFQYRKISDLRVTNFFIKTYFLNSYKGYQMWNAEDSSSRMSWKCARIFPHYDPMLFIVQSNYQFWCATLYTFNEFFKWAPKSAQLSSTELKMSQ